MSRNASPRSRLLSAAPLALALLTLLASGRAAAQTISIVKNADMAFGNLIAGVTGGTAVVSPAGALSTTGSVLAAGGTPAAASFTVSVPPPGNPSWTLILPGSTTLTTGGGASMTLDTFVSNPPCCSEFGRNVTLTVGATLHVGANQQPGNYSGTFTVIVTRP